ncbi:MAG: type II toxin-antitoxin system HicB family antitoxin [Oscillospiraceae bacterium]|nr:type II toxin-antitoxin system HicB family antitoxin [Oscillospiraceae bacterium]
MGSKDINYYLGLPYNVTVQEIHDESGDYYYARVLELDGCQSHGATVEEAYLNIREAMEGWIEVKLEFGDPIPEPISDNNYSGKFNIRIPKSLHRRLAMEAKNEGVSMNQYALYKLAL